MFSFGIVLPVEAKADLLIKPDCMGIVFIHTKIYSIALILCVQSVQ